MLDFSKIMAAAQKQSWGVVALDVAVDTTTPAGEMMANVMATFAQFERRLIGQRTRDALAAKRAAGVVLGRPRQLDGAVVDRIRAERAAGASLAAIGRGLDADGVPTAHGGARWWPATVRAVLQSLADS
jgi:DNA invertase Pin-like site-specific DNA recombinase